MSHDNIYESLVNSTKQTLKNIEAWLSLVERCVRDAEVASSNLVASIPACWSSGQDDALSRRKPGFDSRTGHEAVWNFHTASFLFCTLSTLLFCPRIVPEPPCLLSNFVRRFLFSPMLSPMLLAPILYPVSYIRKFSQIIHGFFPLFVAICAIIAIDESW